VFDAKLEAVDTVFYRLVRRVAPARSTYEGLHQRADWYLSWDASPEEDAIRATPAHAAFVQAHQLVDYTREPVNGTPRTVGWFPLWRPALKRRVPVRHEGLIAATEPVTVTPQHVAGWTRFFDADPAKRDRVPVIRPKEF
jgi:hypothetical protein